MGVTLLCSSAFYQLGRRMVAGYPVLVLGQGLREVALPGILSAVLTLALLFLESLPLHVPSSTPERLEES